MDEEQVAEPLPGGSLGYGLVGTAGEVFGRGGLYLPEGGFQGEVPAEASALQRTSQFAVMVAKNEHATAGFQQVQHGFQYAGTVRSMIDQVAKLDDETLRGDGVTEGIEITVHVSHNAKTMLANMGQNRFIKPWF